METSWDKPNEPHSKANTVEDSDQEACEYEDLGGKEVQGHWHRKGYASRTLHRGLGNGKGLGLHGSNLGQHEPLELGVGAKAKRNGSKG